MDFVFLNNSGTKLVKVHNQLDKQQVNNTLVSWLDTVDKRKIDYDGNESLNIILSEEGFKNVTQTNRDALKEYGIQVYNFSDKKVLQKAFAK